MNTITSGWHISDLRREDRITNTCSESAKKRGSLNFVLGEKKHNEGN